MGRCGLSQWHAEVFDFEIERWWDWDWGRDVMISFTISLTISSHLPQYRGQSFRTETSESNHFMYFHGGRSTDKNWKPPTGEMRLKRWDGWWLIEMVEVGRSSQPSYHLTISSTIISHLIYHLPSSHSRTCSDDIWAVDAECHGES